MVNFFGFGRSAAFYEDNRRTLRKQYAIKILVDLEGEGRRFDFFQLIIKVGATIGLFSLVKYIIVNLIVFNWVRMH